MIDLNKIKKTLQKSQKYWIVFTGDSITSCEWVHPNWRDIVIYVLQNELTNLFDSDWKTPSWGLKGFNLAYDGSTTTDVLNKINELIFIKPNLVISIMGANDPLRGVSVKQSVKNISKIAKLVTQSGVDLIWCNSTPSEEGSSLNTLYKPYAQAFMKMEDRNNFYKLDMFNLYKKFPLKRFLHFYQKKSPRRE